MAVASAESQAPYEEVAERLRRVANAADALKTMCEEAAIALKSVTNGPMKSGRKEGRTPMKRTRKDPDAPKRPATAYTLFVAENRSKHAKDGMSAQAVMKEVAAAWKALTEDQRHPYAIRAGEAKEVYQKQLQVFKAGKAADAAQHDADAAAAVVAAARLGPAPYEEQVDLSGAHAHAHAQAAIRAVLPHTFESFDGIPMHSGAAAPIAASLASDSAQKKHKKHKKGRKHHAGDS